MLKALSVKGAALGGTPKLIMLPPAFFGGAPTFFGFISQLSDCRLVGMEWLAHHGRKDPFLNEDCPSSTSAEVRLSPEQSIFLLPCATGRSGIFVLYLGLFRILFFAYPMIVF